MCSVCIRVLTQTKQVPNGNYFDITNFIENCSVLCQHLTGLNGNIARLCVHALKEVKCVRLFVQALKVECERGPKPSGDGEKGGLCLSCYTCHDVHAINVICHVHVNMQCYTVHVMYIICHIHVKLYMS